MFDSEIQWSGTRHKRNPMNKKLHIRSKIWIEDDRDRVVFGQGRLKILESIERNGSISAAARELRMSYRAVWGKIKATEERLGKKLLSRNVGGGSSLTPFAMGIMKQFYRLRRDIQKDADTIFDDLFSDKGSSGT